MMNGYPLRNDTLDEFIKDVSRPINLQLAKIALNLDITDQTGKGNKDIVRIYGKEAFDILDNTLIVKIPYNKLAMNSNDAQNGTENDTEKSLEEKIINLIRNSQSLSTIKMASELGVSRSTIARTIKSSKRIIRVGPDKGGHWEITE